MHKHDVYHYLRLVRRAIEDEDNKFLSVETPVEIGNALAFAKNAKVELLTKVERLVEEYGPEEA
jgi:hypothetical protein